MTMTRVRVRAQAHGGKYLGPAVKTTPPVLTVLIDGKQVGPTQTFPTLSSGTVVSDYTIGVSPYTIVVQPEAKKTDYYPTPGTYYLLAPDEGQADLIVSLDLTETKAVEFRVTAYASDDFSQPVHGSVTTLLVPGGDYTQLQPGLVVPIHGLRVFGLTATYSASKGNVTVEATVEMMCGCPITQQPRTTPVPSGTEPYWPSTEFEVHALFLQTAPVPIFVGTATLLATTTTSQFSGSTNLLSGTYLVILSAKQPAIMNTGAAVTTVVVP